MFDQLTEAGRWGVRQEWTAAQDTPCSSRSIRMQCLPEPTRPVCLRASITSSQQLCRAGITATTLHPQELTASPHLSVGIPVQTWVWLALSYLLKHGDLLISCTSVQPICLPGWCRDVEGAGVGSPPNPEAQVGAAVRHIAPGLLQLLLTTESCRVRGPV